MPTRRSRLVARALLALLLLAAAPACNKKKSSEGEGDQSAKDNEPPRKIEEPGTAATAEPAESATADDTVDGYRVIKARTKEGESTAISIKAPKGWDIVAAPTEPDPEAGSFTLDEATEGLPKQGTLAVQIKTTLGSFYCDLFSDKAPNTVANFVGLARGKRKFWDGDTRIWATRPYYDGTTFHRVIPGFMIQGGDHTGTGKGGIGYTFADEVHPTLHHDRPGQLCMANRGPNTNEAQFFVTEGATPHLDGSYTVFGQCEPATLVQRISRVPQSGAPGNRPLTPVVIEKVEIRRVAGGAAKWMPESAKLPPMPGVPAPGRAVQVQSPGGPVAPGQ